ncbi:plasmid mobilization relaxosome protein MobC [Photobacterium sp. J15]|uniref:plasmid mobilization relaxosome protein MobC n=1 Tax=Photobacterium sp. J15 TaxID=265901 RepID=UPI0007E4B0E2
MTANGSENVNTESLIINKEIKSELLKVRLELNAIGRNLNQLVRWCNTYQNTTDKKEILIQISEVEFRLVLISVLLNEVVELC